MIAIIASITRPRGVSKYPVGVGKLDETVVAAAAQEVPAGLDCGQEPIAGNRIQPIGVIDEDGPATGPGDETTGKTARFEVSEQQRLEGLPLRITKHVDLYKVSSAQKASMQGVREGALAGWAVQSHQGFIGFEGFTQPY